MSLRRVPFSELEESDPLCPFIEVRWRGDLFTGIAFDETERFVSEYRYDSGYGEGRCISTFRSGQLMEEFELHRGEYVGTSREWFESGQLKREVSHGPPRRERQWNESGLLIEEYDASRSTRRKWFEDGSLRSEGIEGETQEYTRTGALAFTWRPRTDPLATLYAGTTFVPEVMAAHLEELVDDGDREHHVFAWVHSLLDASSPDALEILRRLLAHHDDWVRVTAIELVGNRGVRELARELGSFIGDGSVATSQWERGRGRTHTRSFDAIAREALSKLDPGRR